MFTPGESLFPLRKTFLVRASISYTNHISPRGRIYPPGCLSRILTRLIIGTHAHTHTNQHDIQSSFTDNKNKNKTTTNNPHRWKHFVELRHVVTIVLSERGIHLFNQTGRPDPHTIKIYFLEVRAELES